MNKQNRAESHGPDGSLRKTRSDSNWNGLTLGQCETVERWLFEDNLGYEEIIARVKKEFEVETSRWSVGRFFRQRARVRQSLELLEAQVAADELDAMPARTEAIRSATIKLLAKSAIRLATEKPDELAQLMPLAKLLLNSEENEIRLRRVKLEERYYDFETNAGCAKELEKVRAYLRAVGDNENLNEADKQKRVVALLFGREKVDLQEAEEAELEEEPAISHELNEIEELARPASSSFGQTRNEGADELPRKENIPENEQPD